MALAHPLSIEIHRDGQPPAQWSGLLDSCPAADFFHEPAWILAVEKNCPGLKAVWLTAHCGEEVVGGLPFVHRRGSGLIHQLESSWEGTTGGAVVRGDLPQPEQERVFQFLVKAMTDYRPGLLGGCHLSLNTIQEKQFGHLLQKQTMWQRRDVPGAVIELTAGLEQVEMKQMAMNKRNERNRGLKRGAAVFATNEEKWLDAYYPIYLEANRVWGSEPTPYGLLRDLLQLGSEKAYFICIVLDNRVIGGHLNVVHGDLILAWNGVTDQAFARTHFPATLAVWGDLVEACRRGARGLDLGASGGVHSLSGFKKFFGANIENRGFYVTESAGLKSLRGLRKGLGRLKPKIKRNDSPQRWHDQSREPAGKIVPHPPYESHDEEESP